jgi:hypothetical protein
VIFYVTDRQRLSVRNGPAYRSLTLDDSVFDFDFFVDCVVNLPNADAVTIDALLLVDLSAKV